MIVLDGGWFSVDTAPDLEWYVLRSNAAEYTLAARPESSARYTAVTCAANLGEPRNPPAPLIRNVRALFGLPRRPGVAA